MSGIRHPEYLKSLEDTRYPFLPTASLSNGQVSFPEGTFLDAHLYAVAGSGRYYLSQVVVQSDKLTLTISDQGQSPRLTGEIALPIIDEVVRLVDQYGRSGGMLVSEPARLALLPAWGLGTYRFDREQTEFCVGCQMPVPAAGVAGFRLENGDTVTGEVWLIGEDGVVLSIEETEDAKGNTIEVLRVDVVGDPLYLQRLCEPEELFIPVNPIRVIRVINDNVSYDCTPDEQGNFNIQMNDSLASDAALRVRTTSEGIVITVEGSTP